MSVPHLSLVSRLAGATALAAERRQDIVGSAAFLGTQTVVQLIGAATALLLVRGLSKDDYAMYLFATSLFTTLSVLSDSGVGAALLSVGGTLNSRSQLIGLLQASQHIRFLLGACVAVCVIPVLAAYMSQRGNSPSNVAATITALVVGWAIAIWYTSFATMARLESRLKLLGCADLVGNISRLALVCLVVVFAGLGPAAFVCSVGLIAGQALVVWLGTRDLISSADADATPGRQYHVLVRNVRRMLVPTSFFVLRGQVILWVLAAAGRPGTMADVGVLSRLALLLGPLIASINSIALPRVARLKDPDRVGRVYLAVLLASTAAIVAILSPVALFPGVFVWVVGPQYADLQDSILLAVLSVALVSSATVMSSLNLSRGWNRFLWTEVPLLCTAFAALAMTLDLTSLRGALLFTILSTLPSFAVHTWLFLDGMHAERARNAIPCY